MMKERIIAALDMIAASAVMVAAIALPVYLYLEGYLG